MSKKIAWKRLWARKYAPFIAEAWMQVFTQRKGYGMCRNKLFIPEGNLHAIYFAEHEWRALTRRYLNFLLRQNLPQYARRYEQEFKNFLAFARQFARAPFQKMSGDALAAQVGALFDHLARFGEPQFYAFVVLEGPAKELEIELGKRENGAALLLAIATPYRLTKIAKARIELLILAKEGRADAGSIAQYARKYAWLPMYEFIDKPWTVRDIRQQLSEIKNADEELRRMRSLAASATQTYRAFLGEIRDPVLRKNVEIVHYFSYLKEMRDDYRRHAYFLFTPFWQEVARRTGLSFEETNYLLKGELMDALTKGTTDGQKALIHARKKQYAFVLKDGRCAIYRAPRKVRRIVARVASQSQETSVKGQIAFPGKARGRVAVLYHQGEFDKFKRGDVLVTAMTHPEFVPIMKRASAIVTDEGGLTCHAAIIARELEIPCIIGTKVATKILKDGDRVEVDAQAGIVRKLRP